LLTRVNPRPGSLLRPLEFGSTFRPRESNPEEQTARESSNNQDTEDKTMTPDPKAKTANDIAERAVNTASLVDYQPGAVVSREILSKKTGKVTLFAFDANEGLSEHTSPFDALVKVLEGEVDITIAGTVHRVKAGELILMPAGKPHGLHAVGRFKMMLTMIRS
jgi:quercetin dioxygenase-like cupin family protein